MTTGHHLHPNKNRFGQVLEAIKLIQLFKDVKILGRNQQDLHLQNSTGKVLTSWGQSWALGKCGIMWSVVGSIHSIIVIVHWQYQNYGYKQYSIIYHQLRSWISLPRQARTVFEAPTPKLSSLSGIWAGSFANNRCMLWAFNTRLPTARQAHKTLWHIQVELLQRLGRKLHDKLITTKQGGVARSHVPWGWRVPQTLFVVMSKSSDFVGVARCCSSLLWKDSVVPCPLLQSF